MFGLLPAACVSVWCSAVPPEEGGGAAIDDDGDADGVHEGDHGKTVLVREAR